MNNNEFNPDRRRFFKYAAAAAASLALTPFLRNGSSQAFAAGLPKLPLNNALAKALHYTNNASKANPAQRKAGAKCSTCAQFIPGTNGCKIFQGFQVSPQGWCASWTAKV